LCVLQYVKKWLDDKSINYTSYSVDENPFAAQLMVNMNGQMGVPFSTIEYDDGRVEKILGFDIPKFESILAINK
jgi:hypothetical protein